MFELWKVLKSKFDGTIWLDNLIKTIYYSKGILNWFYNDFKDQSFMIMYLKKYIFFDYIRYSMVKG